MWSVNRPASAPTKQAFGPEAERANSPVICGVASVCVQQQQHRPEGCLLPAVCVWEVFQPVNRRRSCCELWETRCRDLSAAKGSVLNSAAAWICTQCSASQDKSDVMKPRLMDSREALRLHTVVFPHWDLCRELVWLVEAGIRHCVGPVYWVVLGPLLVFPALTCRFQLQEISHFSRWCISSTMLGFFLWRAQRWELPRAWGKWNATVFLQSQTHASGFFVRVADDGWLMMKMPQESAILLFSCL